MDFASIELLRRTHPAWRLLLADHAPLVVSFLHERFIVPNVRSRPQQELVSSLDDALYTLREEQGENAFPKSATEYLDAWASDERGWLRKYYPPDSDEPHFDLTPATEKAIDWLVHLKHRPLVATESRLLTVFELLRQLTEGTEVDPQAQLADLERRRARLDEDIARVREGRLEIMDPARVKDRFLAMAATARALLSDFREVDQGFRDLDRSLREQIARWEGGKGALLESLFGERDAISASDQGKSFRAFFDFLMSPQRQEELTRLLEKVFALPAVQALHPDPRLLRIHHDWLTAGEVTQRTIGRLSAQLRRFLDDQATQENRRITQVIRRIEQHALALRSSPPTEPLAELDDTAPDLLLPMDRSLFMPPYKAKLASGVLDEGAGEVPSDALFEQVYVDKGRLRAQIGRALQTRRQISLGELLEVHPLQQGLSELLTYFSLAADDPHSVIEDRQLQDISWFDGAGTPRKATVPTVIFSRSSRAAGASA